MLWRICEKLESKSIFHIFSYHTVPDDILLQAGSEKVFVNHHTMLKTTKGDIHLSEKDVARKHQSRFGKRSIRNVNAMSKTCRRVHNCYVKRTNIKMTFETKARTPFFLSGPEFSFVFHYKTKTTQSWIDVMVTAARSEQKSHKSTKCFEQYNVNKSIFSTENIFSKFVQSTSRIHSVIVKFIQSERKRPIQISIKIFSKSQLLLNLRQSVTIDLEWLSVLSLSSDISEKTVGLPLSLRLVTLETLNSFQNYTVDVFWIHNLFGSYNQSNDERFCNKHVLEKTNYNYCLNYTSAKNTDLFFWNFAEYLQCYVTAPLHLKYVLIPYIGLGYTISKNNKCPKPQSKVKNIKSWTEASYLCQSIGGYLPLIRNRDELDEIIAFLKLSKNMPPVEALYIGVTGSLKPQVTLLFCHLHIYKLY